MSHADRFDSLLDGMSTARVDIQTLALDFDQAHDHVCASLDRLRSEMRGAVQDSHKTTSNRLDGLSKAVIQVNSRTKHAFLEIGRGLDTIHDSFATKLDSVTNKFTTNVCNKIDDAHGNTNKLVVDCKDHLRGRFDELQEELESSRRRTNERLNIMHKALASIMHTMRDRILQKIGMVSSLLSSMLAVLRAIKRVHKEYRIDHILWAGSLFGF
jgi:ABC-type transporter Mla subunit MlaD